PRHVPCRPPAVGRRAPRGHRGAPPVAEVAPSMKPDDEATATPTPRGRGKDKVRALFEMWRSALVDERGGSISRFGAAARIENTKESASGSCEEWSGAPLTRCRRDHARCLRIFKNANVPNPVVTSTIVPGSGTGSGANVYVKLCKR